MAKLIYESLSIKNSASTRNRIPLAPASHDDGRPFPAAGPMALLEGHTCHIEGVDLLAGNMFIPDRDRSAVAPAHFTGATVNEDNVSDDLVPYGLGSKCGWLPSDHVLWALVQPHPFKDQETKLDLKLQFAVKESAALKPEDLDKLRTKQLQYWTLRALQLEEERAKWVTEAPLQLQRMLASVHGSLVLELCARCSHGLYLANDLQKGLPFVGVLPGSPDFCKTGGEQVCDLSVAELREQRAERNTYVLSRVVPSEWSSDLSDSTVADAQAGYMTPPVPVHHLDLSLISLTRRLPVREERQKGMRTRSVDHFTESGINPATRPQDALTHETADHFISLLVTYMSVGVAPLMWKRDVAKAFRKVPIKYDATDLSWVVFLHDGVLWEVAALGDALRVHVCQ